MLKLLTQLHPKILPEMKPSTPASEARFWIIRLAECGLRRLDRMQIMLWVATVLAVIAGIVNWTYIFKLWRSR